MFKVAETADEVRAPVNRTVCVQVSSHPGRAEANASLHVSRNEQGSG